LGFATTMTDIRVSPVVALPDGNGSRTGPHAGPARRGA